MNNRLVALFLAGSMLGGSASAQQVEIRFLDVGQADAILIRESGKTALIDAGGGAGILAQLRALGVDTIDLIVASHNHSDHIGGMTAVLGGTVVRFYLDNGVRTRPRHTNEPFRHSPRAVPST